MIRAHRAAVVARLAPWRVIDDRAKVDDSSMPSPWVVVDFPPPLKETDRWSAPDQHRGVGWFQTSCVGEDTDQSGRLHDEVESRLLGWAPVVAGWSVWPVRMDTQPRLLDAYTALPDRRLVTTVCRWTWHAYVVSP